jgi:hypothetical protein
VRFGESLFGNPTRAWVGQSGAIVTDDSSQTTPIRTNSDLLWAEEVIEQAVGIIMNRFDLDAERALELLRSLSQHTRSQMCMVAQQIISHHVPAETVPNPEDAAGRANRLRSVRSR